MDQDHDDAEQDVRLFLEDMASAQKYADDLTTLFKVLSVSNKRSKAAERAKATADERKNATHAFRWQRKVQHLELQLEQAVMKLQAERNANDDVNRRHAQLQAMLGKTYGQIVEDYISVTDQLQISKKRVAELEQMCSQHSLPDVLEIRAAQHAEASEMMQRASCLLLSTERCDSVQAQTGQHTGASQAIVLTDRASQPLWPSSTLPAHPRRDMSCRALLQGQQDAIDAPGRISTHASPTTLHVVSSAKPSTSSSPHAKASSIKQASRQVTKETHPSQTPPKLVSGGDVPQPSLRRIQRLLAAARGTASTSPSDTGNANAADSLDQEQRGIGIDSTSLLGPVVRGRQARSSKAGDGEVLGVEARSSKAPSTSSAKTSTTPVPLDGQSTIKHVHQPVDGEPIPISEQPATAEGRKGRTLVSTSSKGGMTSLQVSGSAVRVVQEPSHPAGGLIQQVVLPFQMDSHVPARAASDGHQAMLLRHLQALAAPPTSHQHSAAAGETAGQDTTTDSIPDTAVSKRCVYGQASKRSKTADPGIATEAVSAAAWPGVSATAAIHPSDITEQQLAGKGRPRSVERSVAAEQAGGPEAWQDMHMTHPHGTHVEHASDESSIVAADSKQHYHELFSSQEAPRPTLLPAGTYKLQHDTAVGASQSAHPSQHAQGKAQGSHRSSCNLQVPMNAGLVAAFSASDLEVAVAAEVETVLGMQPLSSPPLRCSAGRDADTFSDSGSTIGIHAAAEAAVAFQYSKQVNSDDVAASPPMHAQELRELGLDLGLDLDLELGLDLHGLSSDSASPDPPSVWPSPGLYASAHPRTPPYSAGQQASAPSPSPSLHQAQERYAWVLGQGAANNARQRCNAGTGIALDPSIAGVDSMFKHTQAEQPHGHSGISAWVPSTAGAVVVMAAALRQHASKHTASAAPPQGSTGTTCGGSWDKDLRLTQHGKGTASWAQLTEVSQSMGDGRTSTLKNTASRAPRPAGFVVDTGEELGEAADSPDVALQYEDMRYDDAVRSCSPRELQRARILARRRAVRMGKGSSTMPYNAPLPVLFEGMVMSPVQQAGKEQQEQRKLDLLQPAGMQQQQQQQDADGEEDEDSIWHEQEHLWAAVNASNRHAHGVGHAPAGASWQESWQPSGSSMQPPIDSSPSWPPMPQPAAHHSPWLSPTPSHQRLQPHAPAYVPADVDRLTNSSSLSSLSSSETDSGVYNADRYTSPDARQRASAYGAANSPAFAYKSFPSRLHGTGAHADMDSGLRSGVSDPNGGGDPWVMRSAQYGTAPLESVQQVAQASEVLGSDDLFESIKSQLSALQASLAMDLGSLVDRKLKRREGAAVVAGQH